MTKDAKGRGDSAPSLSPASILELSRDWPRYAEALRLLRKAPAPAEHDKLRLAKRMIEVCQACDLETFDEDDRPFFFHQPDKLRSLNSDTKAARKAARDLARIIRRHDDALELRDAIKDAVWVGACRYIIEEQNEIILEHEKETGKTLSEAAHEAELYAALEKQENAMKAAHEAGLAWGLRVCEGSFIAAVLEDFADNLPEYIAGSRRDRLRNGIRFRSSLLRKGRSADALTDCLFGLVFHARLATGAGRDAWAIAASIYNAGPMPKDGEPLYDIAAAFASAAFKLEKGELDEKKAADRLRHFLNRNPGAEFEGYRFTCFLYE
jgi:hypothetical protein